MRTHKHMQMETATDNTAEHPKLLHEVLLMTMTINCTIASQSPWHGKGPWSACPEASLCCCSHTAVGRWSMCVLLGAWRKKGNDMYHCHYCQHWWSVTRSSATNQSWVRPLLSYLRLK